MPERRPGEHRLTNSIAECTSRDSDEYASATRNIDNTEPDPGRALAISRQPDPDTFGGTVTIEHALPHADQHAPGELAFGRDSDANRNGPAYLNCSADGDTSTGADGSGATAECGSIGRTRRTR